MPFSNMRTPDYDGNQLITYMAHVRDNWKWISEVKYAIEAELTEYLADLLNEQDERDRNAGLDQGQFLAVRLWKAPSKGGVWSTEERNVMRSDATLAARNIARDKAETEAAA